MTKHTLNHENQEIPNVCVTKTTTAKSGKDNGQKGKKK